MNDTIREGRPAMSAVIREYDTVRGDVDEIVRIDREGFVPLINMEPGFVCYWVAAPESGGLRSVTIHETESGADDTTRKSAAFVKDKLASLLPEPPRITKGALVVYEPNQDLPVRFAVMRRLKVEDRVFNQVRDSVRHGLLPLLSELPGFASHYAVDPGNGTVIIFNTYVDRPSRDQGANFVTDWITKNIGHLVPGPGEISKTEIKLFATFLAVTTA